MNKIIALIAIVVVVAVGWLMFRDSGVDTGLESLNPAVNTDSTGDSNETEGAVKEFTITSKGLSFDPKQIEVNQGDTVRITYINTLGMHDFTIDEFGVKTKLLSAGESETVTFVADKTGTFEFYCSVGTHRQQGMWGMFTVK